MVFSLLVAGLLVLIDQIVKHWTIMNLTLHTSYPVIKGIFEFYYLQNRGAGWGILDGKLHLFYIITPLIMAYILYLIYQHRHDSKWIQLTLGLLLGGAMGNFIDRIRQGYVVDMIRFTWIDFPVFNVADMALTVAAVALIITILFSKEQE